MFYLLELIIYYLFIFKSLTIGERHGNLNLKRCWHPVSVSIAIIDTLDKMIQNDLKNLIYVDCSGTSISQYWFVYWFSYFPISSFRVLTYQPSTVRVPNVQALDTSYLTSSISDYSVPFHHSTLSTIPTDMQSMFLSSLPSDQVCFPSWSRFIMKTNVCVFPKGLDLFSLIQGDPQVYSFKEILRLHVCYIF